jgi:Predicted integral membrane protein
VVRSLLVRGMLAGVVAGLVALVFAYVFGEPGVDGGIAFEDSAAAAAGEAPGVELVSRGVQSTIGLAVAVVVYGVAIGGIYALVYAVIYGRVGRLSPRATAAVLALAAWLVVFVVPFVKYPANPPGSNDGDTISQRTGLYLVMVLFSVLLAVGAIVLRQRLLPRLGAWNATLVGVAAYIVVVGIVEALMPVIKETPEDFPATVLYDFRLASLGGQLVLWAVLGLVFGALVDGTKRGAGSARRSLDAPAA